MNRCTTQDEQLLFLLSQLSPFAIISFWHFSFCNSTSLSVIYIYYFVDMYTQMNRCSAHKIDNCSRLFHLSPFAIFDCAFILKLASVKIKPFVVFWLYWVVFPVISLCTFLLNTTAIPWGMYILVSRHVPCVNGHVPCKKSNSFYVYWLYLFVFHESLIPSYIYIMMNWF